MSEAALLPQTTIAATQRLALRVEFVTQPSELLPLAQQWETFNRRQNDHPANFFQCFAWTHHIARIRAQHPTNHYQQLVATVWRGGDLIGLWPLALQRVTGVWVARELDDPFGQFAGVVFAHPSDITAGVAAIIDALRPRAAGILIEAVVAGSGLHQALLQCGAKCPAAQDAVVVDLRRYASVREFRSSVNSKTRKNLRNLRNRLERAHGIEHVVADTPAQLEPIVRETFEARVQWLQRNGRSSPAFRDEDFRRIVTALPGSDGVELLGFALRTPQRWIAAQWGFVYAKRYYAYISAMDPTFDEFSPGRMHLGMVIESCIERGMEVVELMPPASDYKTAWSDATKRLESMIVPFSLTGRFALELAAGWAAPKVRQLSHVLPEPLRRALVRCLNRV